MIGQKFNTFMTEVPIIEKQVHWLALQTNWLVSMGLGPVMKELNENKWFFNPISRLNKEASYDIKRNVKSVIVGSN